MKEKRTAWILKCINRVVLCYLKSLSGKMGLGGVSLQSMILNPLGKDEFCTEIKSIYN